MGRRRRPVGRTSVPQGTPQGGPAPGPNGQPPYAVPAQSGIPQPAGGPTVLVAGAPPQASAPQPAAPPTGQPVVTTPSGPFPIEKLTEVITVVVVSSENYLQYLNVMMARLPDGLPVNLCWAGKTMPRINRPGLQLVMPSRGGQSDRGFEKAYSLNCAIRHVTTPYTLILDSDMLVPDGFWHFVLSHLHPQTVMRFFVRYLSLAATKRVFAGEPFDALPENKATGKAAPKLADTPNPCVYATQMLQQLRGYDEHYYHNWGGEDDDLTRRGSNFLGLKDVRVPLIVTHLNHDVIKHPQGYRRPKRPRLGKPEQKEAVNPNGWGDGD